jgi:hypothetical protein
VPLPTLADLKISLNKSSDRDDDELAGRLDAAIALVEGIVGPIVPATVTETHRRQFGESLLLRRSPALDITGVIVRPYPGTVAEVPVLADYELDPDGTVRLATGYRHAGDITITYTVGRQDVPADIHEAILVVAGHLWETQRGTAPSALALQGEDVGPTPGLGYALPNRAKDLLAPYVRSAIA